MKTMRILVVLLSGLLAACAVGPRYQRPEVSVPAAVRGAAEPAQAASLADQAWWQLLGDEVLQSLVREALQDGYDVRLAAARVAEARANAGIAASTLYPAVQAEAGAARGRRDGVTSDLYDVQIGLSWEIDLWGRLRHLEEGALAQYLATEEARRGVQLALVADVAAAYFELRALDDDLAIARRTAEAFEGTHALFDKRLQAGLASSLETSSAAAALAATRAAIPDLERRIAAQENLLTFLLGRTPGDVPRGRPLDAQPLPPEVPVGIPSDLLERRPDLRQAEQELVAANAEVGIAVADFFPRLRLTGAFGGVSPEVSNLFDEGKTWSLGGSLLSPVFQGTRLRNEHRAAVARWEQARVRYERAVTGAFGEVATALAAYEKLADAERERESAVAASRRAVESSNSRYLSGLSDYLDVLQAQQQLFPAENALTQTRFERLQALVTLYRALGGGWQLPETAWAGR